MKTIVVGFSRPVKWKPYSWAIMLADKSDASHGYMRFKSSSWGTEFIYQNSGHRTNFMGGELFRKINVVVEEFEIEVDDETESKIGALCVSREGIPYAVKQVIGKAVVIICAALSFGKIRIANPVDRGEAATDCVEECATILSKGLGVKTPLDMDTVTVRPFREWIASLPQARKRNLK